MTKKYGLIKTNKKKLFKNSIQSDLLFVSCSMYQTMLILTMLYFLFLISYFLIEKHRDTHGKSFCSH